MSYETFLAGKALVVPPTGITKAVDLSPGLFPHQRDLVAWALRRGRAALFADCGMGKAFMALEWSRHIAAETNGRVLILAPLAVAKQFEREGEKFGIPVRYVREQSQIDGPISVTNYEMLSHFDATAFSGVVCDESSILKSLTGKVRNQLIESFRNTPFKLACTATPAPNDFVELGNHAEFLGILTHSEMLATFFVHDGGETQTWRLKGHAQDDFWKWICSWAAMVRSPSDLGHDAGSYVLPELRYHETIVSVDPTDAFAAGRLFANEATTLADQRAARRMSLTKRVKAAAEIILGGHQCPVGSQSTKQIVEPSTPPIQSYTAEQKSELQDASHSSEMSEPRTCGNGSPKTQSASRRTAKRRATSATQKPESSTRLTHPSENESSERSPNTTSAIRTSDSGNGSAHTDSLSTTTLPCSQSKAEGAQSAERRRPPTEGHNHEAETVGTTSITVTEPELFGESSAPRAISELESSRIVPSYLSAPRHICGDLEQWVVWCDLNAEQDALAEAFGDHCVSISGSMPNDDKEESFLRWSRGEVPILLSKSSIFGFGVNMQNACKMVFVGLSHSYEALYQSVRRCYRFGQTRPVDVFLITSEAEGAVLQNVKRKEVDAARMSEGMLMHMREIQRAEIQGSARANLPYLAKRQFITPSWLTSENAA